MILYIAVILVFGKIQVSLLGHITTTSPSIDSPLRYVLQTCNVHRCSPLVGKLLLFRKGQLGVDDLHITINDHVDWYFTR